LERERDSLDFDIDGAVIKVNGFELREKAGNHAQVSAMGRRLQVRGTASENTGAGYQASVGRTGAITPVAN